MGTSGAGGRRPRGRRRRAALLGAGAAVTLVAAGCGGPSDAERAQVLRVAYQQFGGSENVPLWFDDLEERFEASHPGVDLQVTPVVAGGNDYFTKLNLMRGSPRTAPDVVLQDTFQINSDIEAGFLLPLDDRLAQWEDWPQFAGSEAATTGRDGRVYGVSMGTDTRGLWHNTDLLEEAGVETPWRPSTWEEVLDAARAVRDAGLTAPDGRDVIPLNVYGGSSVGEVTSMQGVQMLLAGTGDVLYDEETDRWVTGSRGFEDSMGFLSTVYAEGLGPSLDLALDPQLQYAMAGQLIPAQRVAIALDGSWQVTNWQEGGAGEWPEWTEVLDVAPMPTQEGQDPGAVSMSGGFAFGVSATAPDPDLAFELVAEAAGRESSLAYYLAAQQISVRADVTADPRYAEQNPRTAALTELVEVTRFRPAYQEYPRISNEISTVAESVITGERTPAEATADYDAAVTDIVGADATEDAAERAR
ncbi:extracellular solute-binding protein [Pseudokineococcus lusitanus]|uniref:Carbohydrate ABC transporter substrate-binding protein (CUT1 family) n=1 Tax=Pseudokineococcus lusitanus TaxID=763993 RepID=A0A3N1GWN9_9ACTN|nr:extracellular solute-binding protein [Pseudokineococcus lusitanus]ROP34658.1 carbohydrate ABC transporter substrate-binding protein (CUT1 family) [Pseudokineococcus lusitanus]